MLKKIAPLSLVGLLGLAAWNGVPDAPTTRAGAREALRADASIEHGTRGEPDN